MSAATSVTDSDAPPQGDAGRGRRVLVIDSDDSRRVQFEALLGGAGYTVQCTAHELALPFLCDVERFDAVILTAGSEPSTLSAQDRCGQFIVRYMTHVVPALLPRTIVLNSVPGSSDFSDSCVTLAEPVSPDELLAALAACVGS